jgi:hypothetical protein
MSDFEKSPRLSFIDTINIGRAQLNQLEALAWQYLPNENTTLYKWDLIPPGHNYAACNETYIVACTMPIVYHENTVWVVKPEYNTAPLEMTILPLSVLNRLGVEPALSLEKRPGVE